MHKILRKNRLQHTRKSLFVGFNEKSAYYVSSLHWSNRNIGRKNKNVDLGIESFFKQPLSNELHNFIWNLDLNSNTDESE